jgi:hypothetical protein
MTFCNQPRSQMTVTSRLPAYLSLTAAGPQEADIPEGGTGARGKRDAARLLGTEPTPATSVPGALRRTETIGESARAGKETGPLSTVLIRLPSRGRERLLRSQRCLVKLRFKQWTDPA